MIKHRPTPQPKGDSQTGSLAQRSVPSRAVGLNAAGSPFGLGLSRALWALPAVTLDILFSRFAVPNSVAPCFFFPLLSLAAFFQPRATFFIVLGLAPFAGVLRYLIDFPYFAPVELVISSWVIGWLFSRLAAKGLYWQRTPLDVWVVLWAALVFGAGIVELRFGDAVAYLGGLDFTSALGGLWAHLYSVRGLLRPTLVVLSGIAAYVMTVQTVRTDADRRLAADIFVAAAAATALFAVGQYILDFRLYDGEGARASFVARNHLASFLVLAFGVGLGRLKSSDRRRVLAVALVVILGALLFLVSRAAWVATVFVALLYGFSWAPRLDDAKRKQAFVACLAGFALLSASLFLWAWTADVQQRYISFGEDILYNLNLRMLIDSLSARNAFWAAGWEAFSEHPVLGIGLGRFRTSDYIMSRIGRFRHAHNSFLNIAAELGLLGLGLWGALLCRWYVQVWRHFRSTEDPLEASLLHGLLLGVSGFLVTALADDPLFYSEGQVVFWFMLGIGVTSFAAAQRSPRMGVLLAGVLLALAMASVRSPGPLSHEERQELRVPAAPAPGP